MTLTPSTESQVLLSYVGEGAGEAPLDPYKNLITRVALYVLLSHHLSFPTAIVRVDITNQVPFGRGLGSSASAVVAGVLLASALGDLKLSEERIKDYSLMVERHPDNVTAALVGGFTGSFLRTLDPSELSPSSIPLAEVLPAYPVDAGPPLPGQVDPPQPPVCVGRHVRYGFSKDIGVLVVVPKFEVETAKARGALPDSYSRADVVSTHAGVLQVFADPQGIAGLQPATTGSLDGVVVGCNARRQRHLGSDARQGPPAMARRTRASLSHPLDSHWN